MLKQAEPLAVNEYNFISLLLSAMYVYTNKCVIKRKELEYQLYKYYKDDKYKDLFMDICAYKPLDDDPSVNLSQGFQYAFTIGELIKISDNSSDIKYIINIKDDNEALEYINSYPEYVREEIISLANDLKESVRSRKKE